MSSDGDTTNLGASGDDSGGRPAWLLPAAIGGGLALLLVALLTLALRDPDGGSGEDDDTTDTTDTTGIGTTGPDDPGVTAPPATTGPDDTTSTSNSCEGYQVNEEFPLRRCEQGELISFLQYGLVSAGYPLTVDGFFGAETEAVVREFQTANGLPADGILNRETAELLPVLLEPDGFPDEGDTGSIQIDGEPWNIQYTCRTTPEAGTTIVQHLIADQANTRRAVVELWTGGGLDGVVLNSFDRGIGRTPLPSLAGGFVVEVGLDDGSSPQVAVRPEQLATDRDCDVMEIASVDGGALSYGIIDVCTPVFDGQQLTFNSTESEFGTTENFLQTQIDGDAVVGSFFGTLPGGTPFGWTITNGSHGMFAKGEGISGGLAFPDEPEFDDATFSVTITQYPEGGHDCATGQ